jgi:penicillin-binding protein 2A
VVPIFREIIKQAEPYIEKKEFAVASVNDRLEKPGGRAVNEEELKKRAKQLEEELKKTAEKVEEKIKEEAPKWKDVLKEAKRDADKVGDKVKEKLKEWAP